MHCYERKKNWDNKRRKKEGYFMSIKLITNEKVEEGDYFVPLDNKIKIIFSIFLISLFDSVQFLISNIALTYLGYLSISICPRL